MTPTWRIHRATHAHDVCDTHTWCMWHMHMMYATHTNDVCDTGTQCMWHMHMMYATHAHDVCDTCTHNITNLHDTNPCERPRWNPDMRHNKPSRASVLAINQKKCTHRWRLTGTRPKIIQENCKTSWHLYTEDPDPTEQVTDVATAGDRKSVV